MLTRGVYFGRLSEDIFEGIVVLKTLVRLYLVSDGDNLS